MSRLKRLENILSKHRPNVKSNVKQKIPSLTLRFHSYTKDSINHFFAFSQQYFRLLNVPVETKNLEMAIKKWSVLKSPHVHKTTWSQYERRTHGRQLLVFNLTQDLVDKSLWYLNKHLVDGVWIEADIVEFEKLE